MWFCSKYEANAVIAAATLTLAITIGLTIYAWTTKRDFTTMGGCLVSIVVAVIFFSIAIAFTANSYLNMILVLIVIVIYGIYIVYDTQLIAGGRYAELSYDDYIIGALLLYIDIIGLFMYILMLMGRRS